MINHKVLTGEWLIRSGGKINAIINNAKAVQDVEKEFGSMGKYLLAMKKQGIDALLKDLKKRFSYMGDSTSVL